MNNTFKHNEYFNTISEEEAYVKMPTYLGKAWNIEPKHVIFQLARYKFVAKMLSGRLLEVGCGDGYGMPIVLENADFIQGIDIADSALKNGRTFFQNNTNIDLRHVNIIESVDSDFIGSFDGAYSLDVIEHIPQDLEDCFVANIVKTLKSTGSLIIGTPNITAQEYASEASVKEHINLFSHKRLKELLGKYFNNVFMFSMNDEVLHVGFQEMSHYVLALAVGPK